MVSLSACEASVSYSKNSLFHQIPRMLRLCDPTVRRHQRWCALVILLAVCALTVSVATRYTSPEDVSSAGFRTVHLHDLQAPGRQRLMQNAATWHPPFVSVDLLDCVSFYPRVSPAGPPIPSVLFEKSLYNRPPPSSALFA